VSTDLELDVERPVAGGRMIGRHDGRIVFVAGAIPGERVRARIERSARGVLWAHVVDVMTASPHRRTVDHDATCGGQVFRHIVPAFQRQLKSQIIADAFRRVGKLPLEAETPVETSPEEGYRLRARLHVHHGRAGFYRAGSHELCDAAATGQLLPETMPAVEQLLTHPIVRHVCEEILIAENVPATERVLHLVGRGGGPVRLEGALVLPRGVTGVTTASRGRSFTLAGASHVEDTAADLFGDPLLPADTRWVRQPLAFFQGNRYLTGALVRHVLGQTHGEHVLDLYAGVGLFTVALLARGARVTAVEGDPAAVEDLGTNTRPWSESATIVAESVEVALGSIGGGPTPDTIVLDPPRAGLSPEPLADLIAQRCPRLVYVSCDPPTLARDVARFTAAGYRLGAIRAFDLFPNTAHVETVVTLTSGY
jgi:23S rRNA (uracil1939-C5)-methyltransferase